MKRSEIQDQLNKFERMKEDLEDVPVVKTWQEYSQLSETQKEMLQKDWDMYFERVRESTAFRRFKAQGNAWKQRKMTLVKEFGEKARQQAEFEIPKPALEDPMYLENCQTIIRYRWAISKINELNKAGKEYGSFTL